METPLPTWLTMNLSQHKAYIQYVKLSDKSELLPSVRAFFNRDLATSNLDCLNYSFVILIAIRGVEMDNIKAACLLFRESYREGQTLSGQLHQERFVIGLRTAVSCRGLGFARVLLSIASAEELVRLQCDKRLQDMYASFGLKESSDPSQVEQLVDTGGNPLAIVTMEGTMGPNKWTNLGKSLTECCGMIMQGSTLIRVTNHGNRLDQHAHGMPASDKRSVDSFVERTRVSVRRERAAKRPNVTRIRQKLMIIRHYNLRSFTLVKEIKETRAEMRKEKKANFWDSEWNISVEDDEEV
ncbi:hypothetical protein J8273_3985 [Carpediemonas membranifera]|uniref:Uncharacterized protein n=1 Tax=Carpediemonas membranifera TaxID=201153 RepID=A0A8J6AY65_9EUKA|nr:hypothetical protein J8273_3985 [Carpediemonas membranifera]|eukprot:KAG9394350.1 hypothetical protein J8273_3985 [Carpediemonas membranifera]